MRIFTRGLVTLAAAALAISPLYAQTRPSIENASELGQKLFQHTAPTGMVLVVVQNNKLFFQGYGRVSYNADDHPGPDSVVRLCSISKILATDLLTKLVLDKTVSFDDPLQKYAPEGVTVPTRKSRDGVEHPITLLNLATHTAGLPREIAYPENGAAHFTFPDYKFRWDWMQHGGLRFDPGSAAHYSNIGFDLLADAMEKATGKSYAQLFSERTAQPLGLKETTLSPTEAQCSRLMQGSRNEGPCTDTTPAAGSGGMYSTPRDMVRLLRYFLGIGSPAQPKEAQAVYFEPSQLKYMGGLSHAGDPTGLGLGWIIINDRNSPSMIVQKTGGGAGFLTYIALNPATRTGIFVAETEGRRRASSNLFHEVNDILLQFAGLPPMPDDKQAHRPATTAEAPKPGGVDPRKTRAAQKAGHPPVNKAARLRARSHSIKKSAPVRKKAAPKTRKAAPAKTKVKPSANSTKKTTKSSHTKRKR
ncbi:MAG: D-alanyl-D-alanine-carboxypeptidase/endopeptidase AmpH [Acidobacteria bacterium]|nr:D-alanyl-D-alanine-carboxypeptidase/endopeptidase AmpH [Acidobacteriota bacterium]